MDLPTPNLLVAPEYQEMLLKGVRDWEFLWIKDSSEDRLLFSHSEITVDDRGWRKRHPRPYNTCLLEDLLHFQHIDPILGELVGWALVHALKSEGNSQANLWLEKTRLLYRPKSTASEQFLLLSQLAREADRVRRGPMLMTLNMMYFTWSVEVTNPADAAGSVIQQALSLLGILRTSHKPHDFVWDDEKSTMVLIRSR